MNLDPNTLAAAGATYGIPPAILYALGQYTSASGSDNFGLSSGQIAAAGYSKSQLSDNLSLQSDIAAQLLSQEFQRYGTWEAALSAMLYGDPTAASSPTSAAGGGVTAIMGIAGANSTYGMEQFSHALPSSNFGPAAESFAASIERQAQLGGVVTQQHASAFQSYAQRYSGQSNGTPAQAPGARGLAQTNASNLPFQSFQAMPFGSGYMGDETENFGYQWGSTHEVGNDYGMPQGTALYAAMPGTVEYKYLGTGLTAYLRLDNGWTIGYGHLSAPVVPPGTRVNAGDVIAQSGGQPGVTNASGMDAAGLNQYASDPVSVGPGGASSGPHLEIQLIGPDGQYYDPQSILQNTAQRPASMAIGPLGGSSAPQAANTAAQQRQQDREPSPAEIEQFAGQAQAAGLTPAMIQQVMPVLAPLRRMMLGAQTQLTDVAQVAGLDQAGILESVRNTPHPSYPGVTAGGLLDSFRHGTLYAPQLVQRFPTEGEAATFANAGYNAQQIQSYYAGLAKVKADTGNVAPAQPQAPQNGVLQRQAKGYSS